MDGNTTPFAWRAFQPGDHFLHLLIDLSQPLNILARVLRRVYRLLIAEKLGEHLVGAVDHLRNQVVAIGEFMPAHQVIQVPFVSVVDPLFLRGKGGPVIPPQVFQSLRF